MIRPTPEQIAAIANVARHNPVFTDWVQNWYQHELRQLPNVGNSSVQVAQGRCQVLTELYKLLQDSPELTAQPR